jgi:hypothetical protein
MHDEFSELTPAELTRVAGGFLPLLGLIGMGSGLVGQILNGVAQKKAQKSEQLLAQAQAQAQGAQGAPAQLPQTASAAAPQTGITSSVEILG